MADHLRPRSIVVALIRLYQQLLSSRIGANCRYQPTCSSYAAAAIGRFGVLKGGWLGVRRISRCHPLRSGGHDPVPEKWGAR